MDIKALIQDQSLAENISLTVSGKDLQNFANKLVQNSSKELKAGNKLNKLLTRKEVAEIIGVNISTLWRWQKQGILVPIKIGGKVCYRLADIEKIINK